MLLKFTEDAWANYCYWQTQDKKTLKRINTKIRPSAMEILRKVRKGMILSRKAKGELCLPGFGLEELEAIC